jgi:glutamine amidotransferase
MDTTVAVIDYGMGNLHSAAKALECVAPRARVIVTSDPDRIRKADRVVFPGVGAIRDCMAEIRRLELDQLVHEVSKTRPFLAICVGLQSLMQHSEENGGVECLGMFPGQVRFFGDPLRDADGSHLKVPHMGWNEVTQTRAHPLWAGIENLARFYFVHSYFVELADTSLETGGCVYGRPFSAAIGRDNVFAVQFHPEKSQRPGLALLKNFMHWDGSC